MDELRHAFAHECAEQLERYEDGLLLLERQPDDAETVNTLFRCAHTIKGAAGVVECAYIVGFTHVMENLLDLMREGRLTASPDLIALLLACKDHLAVLLDLFAAGAAEPTAAVAEAGERLLERLRGHLPSAGDPKLPVEHLPLETLEGGARAGHDCWHLSLRFGADVLRCGMDPLPLLHFLGTLGEIAHIATLFDALPEAAEMDPEACYLGFEIDFRSQAGKDEIERVFDFVRDDCMLRILPPESRVAEYIGLIQALPEDPLRLGEILVKAGALTREELAAGLEQQAAVDAPPPIGQILVEQQVVQPAIVAAAAAKQVQVSERQAREARLIRVQADKLDKLIDLVGELVIAGASGALMARRSGQGELVEGYALISRLVEEIRNSALQLRMVQVGETFNRFHRVVRDVARELGKEIELTVAGGDTELDKSVVEKIGDPLMHLVRNAMDHGIETAQARVAAGKPARGRIRFNAWHDSGGIVIEVGDDGAGLNRERILAKALQRGLVPAGAGLSDAEVWRLIFEPGFSTAEQVTNLSGRGVGMDVVKRNIEALRGSVEVESEAGRGSRFRIRLPLTLAIIDGFQVAVGRATYIIPLDCVVECLELDRAGAGRDYLNLRGEVLPFIRLRDFFELTDAPPRRENVVVVQAAGLKAGIVVDTLLGEFQTVIKPLGSLFRHLRGIGGSTIVGEGSVALILDVQALVLLAAGREAQRLAPAACQPLITEKG